MINLDEYFGTEENLRVLFAGGGTGGHLMPGAAVAKAIKEMSPEAQCKFMITHRDSNHPCSKAIDGFPTIEMPAARWRGLLNKPRFAWTGLGAMGKALDVFRSFRPQVVVGLGGYSCVAPLILARLLGIRTMLFEGNAIPGRVVRVLAPLVDCVQVQWEVTADRLNARSILLSGNPIRREILEANPIKARHRLGLHPNLTTLLVMGGSQGAFALNLLIAGALEVLANSDLIPSGSLQVLHLTGPNNFEDALRTMPPTGITYCPVAFMHRIGEAYAAADFVLARAGASTIAELLATGRPSILVPYPHATENHQHANAGAVRDAGAALVRAQSNFTVHSLAGLIAELTNSPQTLAKMSRSARAIARPLAAFRVAGRIAEMSHVTSQEQETHTAVRKIHTLTSAKTVTVSKAA
ncbi:MAG: UDP-N-acetylglucosamine--N-acetylmuramyl-(pentapeptide) pyrophosphoryl-undecaprenol N-acetylglucosamine transferase [Planctomycetes bacterium]|nr:UDP-N-acetylglucosamine--N-acetylmuramyl-(pentapeptide) pyrophosphoryl-undecaprenol N-acetylglucosamine transferase [Planctomycetota bacterium]